MQIHIRPAKREDAGRMMELIHELAVFEKEPEAVTVSMEHFVENGFGKNVVWKAWVAEIKESEVTEPWIAGFALYYDRYSTWKGRRLYLEDLIVTEHMRGKGLGKLLFETLLDIAKKENYSGMAWQVLDWNEPAIRFYQKYKASIEDGWLNCNINF